MEQHFQAFPDNHGQMREQGLAYFRYFATEQGLAARGQADQPRTLQALIAAGHVDVEPLVYEDFLPVSAAGIFQSNLGMRHRVITPPIQTRRNSKRLWGARPSMNCSCTARPNSVRSMRALKRCWLERQRPPGPIAHPCAAIVTGAEGSFTPLQTTGSGNPLHYFRKFAVCNKFNSVRR